MRRQIVGSVRAGESVTRVAERLLDIDIPVVNVPEHVRELRDAARFAKAAGDPNIYHAEVQRWQGRINKLGQGRAGGPGAHTMRSATQQLVKDLRRAKGDQVGKVVERWVLDKARYQARAIARHEAVEGFRDVYKDSTAAQEYTQGFRWELSGSHPAPDICDVLAGQDVDGLGPGGYKAGNLPATPHTHCTCFQTAIVDVDHFERKSAIARGEPAPAKPWLSGKTESGDAWMRRQPESLQHRLIGPTRAKALREGEPIMAPGNGQLRPVYEVMGRPKPTINHGPAVNVRPLVRADRAAGQVLPFPRVAPIAR